MPVIIENHSAPELADNQLHTYLLKINQKPIAWFKHQRDQGLACCLFRAAQAAMEKEAGHSDSDFKEIIKTAHGYSIYKKHEPHGGHSYWSDELGFMIRLFDEGLHTWASFAYLKKYLNTCAEEQN